MPKERILVIEDEEDIRATVRFSLEKEGWTDIIEAETGEEGITSATSFSPDIILLDLMLPGVDGITVCRELKSNESTRNVPIIMLTAKSDESDIVVGLEVGADDYITKPFSNKVLCARIRSVLRRSQGGGEADEGVRGMRHDPASPHAPLPTRHCATEGHGFRVRKRGALRQIAQQARVEIARGRGAGGGEGKGDELRAAGDSRGGGGVDHRVCHVGIQRRSSGDNTARVLRTHSSKGSSRSGAVCDGRRRRRSSRRRCCRGVRETVDWEKEDAGESEKEDLCVTEGGVLGEV